MLWSDISIVLYYDVTIFSIMAYIISYDVKYFVNNNDVHSDNDVNMTLIIMTYTTTL